MLIILLILIIVNIIIINLIYKIQKSSSQPANTINNQLTTTAIQSSDYTDVESYIPYITDINIQYYDMIKNLTPSNILITFFPYINITYINNILAGTNLSFDNIITQLPNYNIELFKILTDNKYKTIYEAIFENNKNYRKLYLIYYGFITNLINYTDFNTDSDVKKKFFIKKILNDNTYFYLLPFNTNINNINETNDSPIVTDIDMINTVCKNNDIYKLCRIQIQLNASNFKKFNDIYYNEIVNYLTLLFFVDILKKYNNNGIINILQNETNKIITVEKILRVTVPQLFL